MSRGSAPGLHATVGGGGRSTKVLVAPAALAKLPDATVVDGLGTPA